MLRTLLAMVAALTLAVPAAQIHDARAHGTQQGSLLIDHAWARDTGGRTGAGAAYMKIVNEGEQMERLIGATSPAANVVELHTHIRDGDIMRMRQVDNIEVGAGQSVDLKPGGLHVMLIGLTGPLKEGASFPLTLTFEQAGEVTVEVKVESATAGGSGHH